MAKASTYKGVRAKAAKKPSGATRVGQPSKSASASSRSTRYRHALAAIDRQLAQINATLDEAERIMDEAEAG